MDISEIRQMTDDQIIGAIDDNREEMWKLRFQNATGELKNTNLMRANKRQLAQLKTILGERRQAQASDTSSKEKKNG